MTAQQLSALAPLITLSVVILVQMMAIAFRRNLLLTLAFNVGGLLSTLAALLWVRQLTPLAVTPLLVVDGYALFFGALVVVATLAVSLLAYDYFRHRRQQADEFFMLLLLAALGGLVLTGATHIASFVLGLELLGVSLYALVSYPARGTPTVEAAIKYLILSGVSSAFILFGAALLYAHSGSLAFDRLAAGLADGGEGVLLVTAGTAMVFAGAMFKLSLVPFHMWTPDVYEGAPAPVTVLVATVSKTAIFAALLRLFIDSEVFRSATVMTALGIVAMASMLVGNLLALRQQNVKRILAYSSIAHLGYLMVALISAGQVGGSAFATEAAAIYMLAYVLTLLVAFGAVSVLSVDDPVSDYGDLAGYVGLFWSRPLLAVMLAVALLSLAGIPLTVGFIGKFYLFGAAVNGALWWLLAALILGSGIGLYYYLRIIYVMTVSGDAAASAIPAASGAVLGIASILLVWLGVYPAPVIDFVNRLL